MGNKVFRFNHEAATKHGSTGTLAPSGEEAQQLDTMRALIRSNMSPEQAALLQQIVHGGESAARPGETVDSKAVQHGVVNDSMDLLKSISQQTGIDYINLAAKPKADRKLREVIKKEQAETLKCVPVEETPDGAIVVAIADPSNPTITDDLRLILNREVITVIADEGEINERIEQYYGLEKTLVDILEEEEERAKTDTKNSEDVLEDKTEAFDISRDALTEDSPLIKRMVDSLLLQAVNNRASDVHIEPFPNIIRIRYRVDGVLQEVKAPGRQNLLPLISRIKVMANLDISETRLPQDGRVKLTVESREVDLRVSTVPTVHGEAIVMRVLDKGMMMIGISNIGMLTETLERFRKLIKLPNGIILVTGPTGSGKTTTLYAALAEIKDPGEKFITTEDPVEYEMDGIQQVNINERVGLTYARCLRAILRQDPDRVLVGEIRDVETAQIAVQAALTGHLVMSTLHTNSACATITRLLDMGVEPFLITSALIGVIGQRLVRTICQHCKEPYSPDEEELLGFGVTMEELEQQGVTLYHGTGCAECMHSGYHGRMGIYELLEINDDMRELILERGTTDELQEIAVREGMMTMREDGWIKICMGLTTLEEVARQTPADYDSHKPETVEIDEDEQHKLEESQQHLLEQETQVAGESKQLEEPTPEFDSDTNTVSGEAGAHVNDAQD